MRSPGFRHHNNCTRCSIIGAEDIPGEEVYQLLSLRFKIEVAKELARGYLPHRVERGSLERWLDHAQINPHHVDHLPSNLGPGIEVTLPNRCGMPIIDGNHRAARSLLDGTDFFVYVLSESETLASSTLAMLAQLFRCGKLTHHGAFFNAKTGQMSTLLVDPALWAKTRLRSRQTKREH